ncbi:hypothetical protein LDL59_06590 [Kaistella anthropi]|nr:hypothetical protein [Kaistella anthropi]
MQSEFAKLNKIIGALLKTRPSNLLSSPIAKARALGEPYDEGRVKLFEKLFIHLKQDIFENIEDKNLSPESFRNFAFLRLTFQITLKERSLKLRKQNKLLTVKYPSKTVAKIRKIFSEPIN